MTFEEVYVLAREIRGSGLAFVDRIEKTPGKEIWLLWAKPVMHVNRNLHGRIIRDRARWEFYRTRLQAFAERHQR